tara:strand:- start:152 stop:733 length:582 start_codon:yes stop_codon:yes gene_type:complete
MPATAALLVGSEQIISSLFGYGAFSNEAVINSSKALYYFALGLPAFALIKIFSSFFFANHDTKTPFYISLFSVALNILISLYYFRYIGFIIIPIATTISSWFNSIVLFIYLINRSLFRFNITFTSKFLKIIFASISMGLFFKFLTSFFVNQLAYYYEYKILFLFLCVILCVVFYFLISILIKAFNSKDLKLKY